MTEKYIDREYTGSTVINGKDRCWTVSAAPAILTRHTHLSAIINSITQQTRKPPYSYSTCCSPAISWDRNHTRIGGILPLVPTSTKCTSNNMTSCPAPHDGTRLGVTSKMMNYNGIGFGVGASRPLHLKLGSKVSYRPLM